MILLMLGAELFPGGLLVRCEECHDLLLGVIADLLDFLVLFGAGQRRVVSRGLNLADLVLADGFDFVALVGGEVQTHRSACRAACGGIWCLARLSLLRLGPAAIVLSGRPLGPYGGGDCSCQNCDERPSEPVGTHAVFPFGKGGVRAACTRAGGLGASALFELRESGEDFVAVRVRVDVEEDLGDMTVGRN